MIMNKNFKYLLVLCTVVLGMLTSCDKLLDEEIIPPTDQEVTQPELTTIGFSDVTQTSAKLESEVLDDFGNAVTERGVCYSATTEVPTIADTKIVSGAGIGTYTCSFTGLTQATTYNVVAYATTKKGTGYSTVQKLRTKFDPASFVTGTVSDVEGNSYVTVKIGNQTWMAENLKAVKYRNGDAIATTTANQDISFAIDQSPKYQWAYDTNAANATKYGRLYTWYAVTDSRGIAPTGWHVATSADWKALKDYLEDYRPTGMYIWKGLAATTDWALNPSTGVIGNDLSLNNSFKFEWLTKFRNKLLCVDIVKSPCFLRYNEINPIEINTLFTWDDLQTLNENKDLYKIKLGDTWFDYVNDIVLYDSYIKPRAFYGSKILSKLQDARFHHELVADSISKINSGEFNSYNGNFLLNISSSMFDTIISAIDKRFFVPFVEQYINRKLMSDETLNKLLSKTLKKDTYERISKYQVPSLRFVKFHEKSLNVISIIKTMIAKRRIDSTYIDAFMDDILKYDKRRIEIHGNGVLFSDNNVEKITDEDKNEYRQDIMVNIYENTSNMRFRSIYEEMRGIIKEPVPSVDKEVLKKELAKIMTDVQALVEKIQNL